MMNLKIPHNLRNQALRLTSCPLPGRLVLLARNVMFTQANTRLNLANINVWRNTDLLPWLQ